MSDTIVLSLRCEGCRKPAVAKQVIGDPCPHDCQHCAIVRAVESGRYVVEIAAKLDGTFRAAGLIGENLSREFGVKDYATYVGAERAALKWISRKVDEAN